MTASLPRPAAPAQDVTRSVLSIKPFRKLWNSMVFSSLGDWLGLLATTALAQQLSGGSYSTANFAIAGVFIARLLPAVFLGPLAGVLADRFDGHRRYLARSVIHIYSDRWHIFLALCRNDLGRMLNALLVAG